MQQSKHQMNTYDLQNLSTENSGFKRGDLLVLEKPKRVHMGMANFSPELYDFVVSQDLAVMYLGYEKLFGKVEHDDKPVDIGILQHYFLCGKNIYTLETKFTEEQIKDPFLNDWRPQDITLWFRKAKHE